MSPWSSWTATTSTPTGPIRQEVPHECAAVFLRAWSPTSTATLIPHWMRRSSISKGKGIPSSEGPPRRGSPESSAMAVECKLFITSIKPTYGP